MKKALFISTLFLFGFSALFAQSSDKPFKGRFDNDEYKVYLVLNLHDQTVKVPGQDLYGELPGYLGKRNNSFCWLITGCKVKSSSKAKKLGCSGKLKSDNSQFTKLSKLS